MSPGRPPAAIDAGTAGIHVASDEHRGWRSVWTERRARLWLLGCAIAVWLPIVGVPFRGWFDFSAFYVAGLFAFRPEVIRLAPIVTYQAEHDLPVTPFVYPASVALPYVPLAQLPYLLAGAVHVVIMFAALLLAVRVGARAYRLPVRWAYLGALAWAPAAASVLSGQNTTVALLLVAIVAWLLSAAVRPGARRELAVGAAVGALLYKPQLAAPIVGTLGIRGRWLALGVVVLGVALHYLLGTLATGGDWGWPGDWLATLRDYTTDDVLVNGWQAISLPGLLARAGLVAGTSVPLLVGYLVGGLVVLATLPSLRGWSGPAAVALAAAAGLVVSPHALVYDATLLLPALALFARAAAERGWPWQDRWLLAAVYVAALVWPLVGFEWPVVGRFTQPLALVVLLAPALLLGWGPLRRRSAAAVARV